MDTQQIGHAKTDGVLHLVSARFTSFQLVSLTAKFCASPVRASFHLVSPCFTLFHLRQKNLFARFVSHSVAPRFTFVSPCFTWLHFDRDNPRYSGILKKNLIAGASFTPPCSAVRQSPIRD